MKMKKTNKRFNNMGFIISTSFFLVTAIIFTSNILLNDKFISKYFLMIENENMHSRINQVDRIFQKEIRDIANLTKEYAVWDNTYFKIREKSSKMEWFNHRLLSNYSIDMVAILNDKKEIFCKHGIDEDVSLLLDDTTFEKLISEEKYSDKLLIRGFKEYKGDIYLIGACPVFMSNSIGPSQGIVILGKKVTQQLLKEIKNSFGYDIFILNGGKYMCTGSTNDLIKNNYDTINVSTNKISYLGKDYIVGKTPLYDINNKTIGSINVVAPRNTLISTQNILKNNIRINMIIASVLILIVCFILKKIIANPIKNLEEQIDAMSQYNSLEYVNVEGTNEVINLGNSFNYLINNINKQKKENEDLKVLSNTDSLTSLYNHRYFYEYLNQSLNEKHKTISIIFCDIDKFKYFNDTYGYVWGDKVLRRIASIIKAETEGIGNVFRYSGEKFAVILCNFDSEKAYRIAEKIRNSIQYSSILEENNISYPLTVSLGIATYPTDALDIIGLVEKADKAVHFSKINGRNQTTIYNKSIDEFAISNSEKIAKSELLIDSVLAFSEAIDAKDEYTGKHSNFVTEYSLLLAEKLNLSPKEKYLLKMGALLHDCGKIGIPDDIIRKPSKLTDEEYNIIKSHTTLGHNIIKYMVDDKDIIACIRNHHERWDGKGYPDGLEGENIPQIARIVCIADAYHAMVSDRPYRKALKTEDALQEILRNRWTQFDPKFAELFVEAIMDREKRK